MNIAAIVCIALVIYILLAIGVYELESHLHPDEKDPNMAIGWGILWPIWLIISIAYFIVFGINCIIYEIKIRFKL